MTNDELLAKINQYDAYTYDPNESLIKALRAVVELPKETPWNNGEETDYIFADGYKYAMKLVIQAIEKELR